MELLKEILTRKENNFNYWDNSICLCYRGSISHGTYIPKEDPNAVDDKDIMGLIIPPIDYYFGLPRFEQFKKIEQYWDVVIYDFKKAISLLVKSNPNIMQLLWTPEKFIIKDSEEFKELRDNRHLFSSKKVHASYCGYAYSQLKKMERFEYAGYMGAKRKDLVNKFGYDTKHASHLIRLLRQGIFFLKTGELEVERHDAEELKEIKSGKWLIERVQREAEKLFKELDATAEKSGLPEFPDYERINDLMTTIIWNWFHK